MLTYPRTGGIGSYALITLVSAFLQLHISRRPRDTGSSTSSKAGGKKGSRKKGQQPVKAEYLEPSLGVLLVDFFRFFGRIINMQQAGLSCADGGHFFNKVGPLYTYTTLQGLFSQPISPSLIHVAMLHVGVHTRRVTSALLISHLATADVGSCYSLASTAFLACRQ
jgi:hypothetical protein